MFCCVLSAKDVDRGGHRLNRVRPAKVGPTVTAWACHPDSESPASQRLIRHALKSAAVDCDEITLATIPRWILKQVPNASQIPFTFLADVPNGDNRAAKPNPARLRRA